MRFFGDGRQFSTIGDQGIHRKHRRAAGVGENRQARAFGPRLLGEHLGHVKQVGDVVDAQYARASKRGFEHIVAAGERAGVACRGFRRPDRFGRV